MSLTLSTVFKATQLIFVELPKSQVFITTNFQPLHSLSCTYDVIQKLRIVKQRKSSQISQMASNNDDELCDLYALSDAIDVVE